MKYFKNNNNEVFAYDDEQVSQGYGKDMEALESGEFYDGTTSIKPYKLDDSYIPVERDENNNIVAPQGLVEQLQAEQAKALQDSYTKAMEAYMDAKAQERGYDTRYTASLRVNSTVEEFRLEGQAFIDWMDNCYAKGYEVLADVQSGTRPLPTVDEFLAELPKLVW